MTSESELIEFPCEFPLKVMGRALPGFEAHVHALVERNVAPEDRLGYETRASRNGRFISLTVNIRATSRAQLDQLYRELSADERILVVL